MNTLFKYYSSTFDLLQHLHEPSIKLATTTSLNDPFEKELSEDLALNLTNILLERDIYKNKSKRMINELKKDLINSYKNISKNYGIVSLTETHRNLLMWSHYGSAHKGVCIGYKTSMFSDIDQIRPDMPPFDLNPQRVRYDSKRFDSDVFYDRNRTTDILMQAIRTKSDEWMYEKEHRSIIPFAYADKIVVHKNENNQLHSIILQCEHENIMVKNKTNKNKNLDVYDLNKDSNKNNVGYLASRVAHYNEVMVLKNISIKNISSIYLGSEYEFKDIKKIIEYLKLEPERYGHVKLFKYEVNKNNFALDLIPLNSKSPLDTELENRAIIYHL